MLFWNYNKTLKLHRSSHCVADRNGDSDATNGLEILEFDYITGLERELAAFPTPVELWSRPKAGILTSNPACY